MSADSDLLLHAALDGELDAAGTLAFEQAMARDPALAADYSRIATLQKAVRTQLPVQAAPIHLRQRIAAMAASQKVATRARAPILSRRTWLAHAATALLAAGLGAGATKLALAPVQSSIGSALIGAHMRGLLATSPVDVLSSDRHTVKPWFDAHLGQSPPVPDLLAQGFELLGGRVDVVGGAAVPTLVYRRRGHVISVTAIPHLRVAASPAAVAPANGYRALAWADESFSFLAIADLELQDLDSFVQAFRKAQSS